MEDALIDQLTRSLPQGQGTFAGIGDDCAVTHSPRKGELLLLKTDCIVEGIHFAKDAAATQVGWKALCRAISDIAACGGIPTHALITFAAPPDLPIRWLKSVYRGLARAARQFDIGIVGGESARSPKTFFLSVTLIGRVLQRHLVLRSGAQPGDSLFVTGRLGGSLRGHHLRFTPRLLEARWLTAHFPIHAMMDLSDGLGSDLPRMARASHTGFEVQPQWIPKNSGCSFEQAISDGEDYELLFAISPQNEKLLFKQWPFPRLKLTKIGQMTAHPKQSSRLPPGYDHFK